jgi:hypothetical protein
MIKQKHSEPIPDYIRMFRNTRNWCFNLNISDKDLTDSGLSLHLNEKLDGHNFYDVSQVLKGLWIVKAELRSLEASLGVMISL